MLFRKFLAVILIIIFVPIFIITALGWNLKLTVLNPSFLTDELAKNKIYESAIGLSSDLLINSLTRDQDNLESQGLSSEILKNAFRDAVSPNLLQEQAELIVKAGFNYFYGQTTTIKAVINLKSVKENLNGALGKAMEESFSSLPQCESTQKYQSQQGKCWPPGIKLENRQFTQMLPDNYDLSTIIGQFPVISAVRQYFSFFLIGLYVLTTTSILLLAIIALLIFSPASSVLKWLATALLIPGIILFGTAFLNLAVSVFIKGSSWGFPDDASIAINNLISSTAADVIRNFLFLSGGLIVLAVIFYILASVFKPKTQNVIPDSVDPIKK